MNNIFRFFIGLIVFLVILVITTLLAVFLYPSILIGSISILLIIGIIWVVYIIIGILAVIWYLSREEPKIKKNKNYSIDQGKEK